MFTLLEWGSAAQKISGPSLTHVICKNNNKTKSCCSADTKTDDTSFTAHISLFRIITTTTQQEFHQNLLQF